MCPARAECSTVSDLQPQLWDSATPKSILNRISVQCSMLGGSSAPSPVRPSSVLTTTLPPHARPP